MLLLTILLIVWLVGLYPSYRIALKHIESNMPADFNERWYRVHRIIAICVALYWPVIMPIHLAMYWAMPEDLR